MSSIVIGIAGGTGSGKTTLARRIHKAFGKDSVMISMDCYYKDNHDMPFEERCKINYDHPDSIDMQLLTEHIAKLKNGETVYHPTYDFSTHSRCDEWIETKSARVVIIEGIMAFQNPDIVNMLDIKIYVDTDADVRIIRRIMRDVNERGRSLESVVKQYLTTWKQFLLDQTSEVLRKSLHKGALFYHRFLSWIRISWQRRQALRSWIKPPIGPDRHLQRHRHLFGTPHIEPC